MINDYELCVTFMMIRLFAESHGVNHRSLHIHSPLVWLQEH